MPKIFAIELIYFYCVECFIVVSKLSEKEMDVVYKLIENVYQRITEMK